jgi:hypothetical protein
LIDPAAVELPFVGAVMTKKLSPPCSTVIVDWKDPVELVHLTVIVFTSPDARSTVLADADVLAAVLPVVALVIVHVTPAGIVVDPLIV